MEEQFSRLETLIGKENLTKLQNSRVAVFGIGGVGGYTVEALVRCGIGTIDIVDSDKVAESNLNRQIYALHSTIGKYKVDVAKERILDINPNIKINTYKTFYTPQTSGDFDFSQYDYIVDAIDTVVGKIELVMQANEAKTPIICLNDFPSFKILSFIIKSFNVKGSSRISFRDCVSVGIFGISSIIFAILHLILYKILIK